MSNHEKHEELIVLKKERPKSTRIIIYILILLFAGFLGNEKTIADQSVYLPTDFNRDGVVDVRDITDFLDQWLTTEGQQKAIPVYGCGCLNQKGAKYVLQNDITGIHGYCFTIEADDISFDLGGQTISGTGIVGIEEYKHSGLSVSNGNIKGFSNGIFIFDCNDTEISRMSLTNNSQNGIYVNSETLKISYISANNNVYGIQASCSYCDFSNITANYNARGIIGSFGGGSISGITANNNTRGNGGIEFISCYNTSISDIEANSNEWAGLWIDSGSGNTISSFSGSQNVYSGLIIIGDNNHLSNITSSNNGHGHPGTGYEGYGIGIEGSNNLIMSSSFYDNRDKDVGSSSTSNIFRECTYDTEEGSLIRQYVYQAIVEDDLAQLINDAQVSALRQTGDIAFTLRTNPDGATPEIPVTSYVMEDGEKINYAPLTITAEKDGLISINFWDPNGFNPKDYFTLGNINLSNTLQNYKLKTMNNRTSFNLKRNPSD
jgi:hypothetical protein